ncbi:FAD-dependent oxidoreductase [Legionella sp.]|uniref:NAD(P)/FAD-dependent oxidoreductase n=1 Tax=Legionella sp. TaxID=459 RepID=UPI00257BFC61|nr:FAD-dependent oxidoreductase [Legionella sp.]
MSKRIAVIGSGISGLVSAYLLSERYDVSLFEANDYLGGHTNTVSVDIEDEQYSIDTGFIVFNKKTYPNFFKLIEKLNIPIQLSEMSFSYRSISSGFEYNGHSLNTLFSDRRNLFKLSFYRFIKEILLFNDDAKKFLAQAQSKDISIKEFLERHQYSDQFMECYLIPMMSAVWSKNKEDTLHCSAHFIFKFYANHGLLDLYNRPPWYVITQGSKSYIPSLIKKLNDRIFLNTTIETIQRAANHVVLKSEFNESIFDCVVIATHSDQALKLLSHPTEEEINILSAIKYRK